MKSYGTTQSYVFDDGHYELWWDKYATKSFIDRLIKGGAALTPAHLRTAWGRMVSKLKSKPRVYAPDLTNCAGKDSNCEKGQKCIEFKGSYSCVPKDFNLKEIIKKNNKPKRLRLLIQKTNYKKGLSEKKQMRPKNIQINKHVLKENIKALLLKNPQLLERLILTEMPPVPPPAKNFFQRWMATLKRKLGTLEGMFGKPVLGGHAGGLLNPNRTPTWLLKTKVHGGSGNALITYYTPA